MGGDSDKRPAAGLGQVAGIGVAMFLGLVIAVAAVAKTFVAVPAIGDIVMLRPATEMPRESHVELAVRRIDASAGSATGRTCVLAAEIMAKAGGSLVVESRGAGLQPTYLVHWAGGATSRGADDCGASADLEVTATDLQRLAQIAGGFGADPAQSSQTVQSMAFPGMQFAQD